MAELKSTPLSSAGKHAYWVNLRLVWKLLSAAFPTLCAPLRTDLQQRCKTTESSVGGSTSATAHILRMATAPRMAELKSTPLSSAGKHASVLLPPREQKNIQP